MSHLPKQTNLGWTSAPSRPFLVDHLAMMVETVDALSTVLSVRVSKVSLTVPVECVQSPVGPVRICC
jgi:hypothetical protein